MDNKKRLRRTSNDSVVAGVCGGIAEYFDADPTIIRVLYVILSIASIGFPGIITYLILMLIMPKDV